MAEIEGAVIERKRGDTAPDVIIVLDENGVPRDITGYAYTFTINQEKNPADITQQLVQIAGQLTQPLVGRVEFPWTPVDADQVPGKYWYDVQQVDGAGKKKTIAK